jgi:hypothetical protein
VLGLAVLQDTLVVAGGADGTHRLCSAEIYNEEYERWDRLPDMCFRRAGLYLSSCGGFLTAFGGMNNFGKLKSVEQYDPDLEKWVRIGDMPRERSCMAGTTFKMSDGAERVVLLGGRDRLYSYLDSVDIFDPASGVWSSVKVPNLPENVPYLAHRRDAPACAVLGWPVYEEDDDLIKEGTPEPTPAPSPRPLAIEAAAPKEAGEEEEKAGEEKEKEKGEKEEEEEAEEEQGPEGQGKRPSVVADEKRKRMIAEAAARKQ